jgi:hypothetical protein
MSHRELSAEKRTQQEQLVEYLNQDLDPYDYGWLIPDWDETKEADFEALNDDERKRFTTWLKKKRDTGYKEFFDDPDAPSYLYFSGAEVVPADEWFVHFTHASPFFAFKHGATAESLALTRHRHDKHRMGRAVSCPQNPANSIFETAYGFALHAKDAARHTRSYAKKYGQNAVLFKHAHAVSAYHTGDDEHQVIFPICSEYDGVPIYDVAGECLVPLKSGERQFDNLKDVIAWFDSHRVKTAFHGISRPPQAMTRERYWAPEIAAPKALSGTLFRHVDAGLRR